MTADGCRRTDGEGKEEWVMFLVKMYNTLTLTIGLCLRSSLSLLSQSTGNNQRGMFGVGQVRFKRS